MITRCFYLVLGYPTKLVKSFTLIFQERIGLGSVVQGGKSKSLLLSELGQELGTQRDRLNKRMQGNFFHTNLAFPTFQKPEKHFAIYLYIFIHV